MVTNICVNEQWEVLGSTLEGEMAQLRGDMVRGLNHRTPFHDLSISILYGVQSSSRT
jgi:hypothetical protein